VAQTGFDKATMEEVDALFARYPRKINALLPLLHLVQRENAGWISPEWVETVADMCETTVNHVRGVITFYNMFRTTAPGKYHIMVCASLPCGVCGGKDVLHHLEHKLGIGPGMTTNDGLFSLEEVQCLASCDKAPLMVVNEDRREKVAVNDIDSWIESVRANKG